MFGVGKVDAEWNLGKGRGVFVACGGRRTSNPNSLLRALDTLSLFTKVTLACLICIAFASSIHSSHAPVMDHLIGCAHYSSTLSLPC